MARFPARALSVPRWWRADFDEPPVLIELTHKRWKALILLAHALALLGLTALGWQMWSELYRPLLEASLASQAAPFPRLESAVGGVLGTAGWVLLATGLAVGIYARFMAWWRHG